MVPEGMEKIVNYMKERYNNMPMFVTENGEVSEPFIFFVQNHSVLLVKCFKSCSCQRSFADSQICSGFVL